MGLGPRVPGSGGAHHLGPQGDLVPVVYGASQSAFGSGSEDSGEEGEAQGEEEEDTGLAEIVRYREQFILWLTQEQGYIAGED